MADSKLFTFLQKKDTDEIHLFPSITRANNCFAELNSICKKMKTEESEKSHFNCLDDEDARFVCANLGRTVCGTCVSSLYGQY